MSNSNVLFVQCPHGHHFAILDDDTPAKRCPGCGTSTLTHADDEFVARFLAALAPVDADADSGAANPPHEQEGIQ